MEETKRIDGFFPQKQRGKHMISAYLDEETYIKGKHSGIRWAFLIKRGLEVEEITRKYADLVSAHAELERKQLRTAELLHQYAAGGK